MHRVQDRRAISSLTPQAGAPVATRRVNAAIVVGVAAGAVVLDQIVKTIAEHGLRDRTIELGFGPKLLLTYNSGAAFSVGAGRSGVFTVLASVAVVAVLSYALWLRQRPWQAVAFGLIVGGAAGNLVDRLARPNGGRVIDFIQIAKWWPVFNIADMSLFFGVALLLLLSLREGRATP